MMRHMTQQQAYQELTTTFIKWKNGEIDTIDRDISWLRTGFNFNDPLHKERYLVMLQTNPEELYLVLWCEARRIADEK